jgi:hypothetical protein
MRKVLVAGGLVATAALTACNGWPRVIAYNEAQNKPEKYPTYAAVPGEMQAIAFQGRQWIVSPSSAELPGAQLQSVGNAGNLTVYAPKGTEAPYSVLFAPAGGTRWHQVLPID